MPLVIRGKRKWKPLAHWLREAEATGTRRHAFLECDFLEISSCYEYRAASYDRPDLAALWLSMTTVHAMRPDEVETTDLNDSKHIEDLGGILLAGDGHPARLLAVGCAERQQPGQLELSGRDCPGGDRGPPDPPEDEPPDPDNPPPTPPPPEIIRTITVPTDFIGNAIGSVFPDPRFRSRRPPAISSRSGTWRSAASRAEPGPAECRDRCKDIPPKQFGRCMEQCRNQSQTCEWVWVPIPR